MTIPLLLHHIVPALRDNASSFQKKLKPIDKEEGKPRMLILFYRLS
jgi:hypothetical protein